MTDAVSVVHGDTSITSSYCQNQSNQLPPVPSILAESDRGTEKEFENNSAIAIHCSGNVGYQSELCTDSSQNANGPVLSSDNSMTETGVISQDLLNELPEFAHEISTASFDSVPSPANKTCPKLSTVDGNHVLLVSPLQRSNVGIAASRISSVASNNQHSIRSFFKPVVKHDDSRTSKKSQLDVCTKLVSDVEKSSTSSTFDASGTVLDKQLSNVHSHEVRQTAMRIPPSAATLLKDHSRGSSESDQSESGKPNWKCPFYKRIPGIFNFCNLVCCCVISRNLT